MTASRQRRKQAELLGKLTSLTDDLDLWLAESAAGGAAEKHHSQVRRVAAQLRPLAALVQGSITGEAARNWPALETNVLDLHRVWGFFREKLALRRLPEFTAFLRLADEYAWACYRPAQEAAVAARAVEPAAVREPPLVYLSSSAGPFSIARGESYGEELGAEGLSSRSARLLVRRLPVPVIGVPWFQPQHLPDALVIGHEVGHIVLNEMIGLSTVRDLAVAAAGAGSSARPKDWAEEIFADVYGALCGGQAYVDVLADFLDGPDDSGLGEERYPPARARIALCQEALRTPSPASAAESDVDDPLDGAVRRIARALVETRFPTLGDRPLNEVMPPAGQGGEGFSELLDGWEPATRDVRTLLAVAAQAFAEDPERYRASGAQGRVLTQAGRIQEKGTRYRGGGENAALAAISARDAGAAPDLFALLTGHQGFGLDGEGGRDG